MSKAHWLALLSISGVGGVTARRLIETFGSVEAVFEAADDELDSVPRFSPEMIEQLHSISLEAVESQLDSLSDEGIDVLTWEDESYPANLRQVNDAPPLLFMCGRLRKGDSAAVAIVGTREPTPRSASLAEQLGFELASRGLTVVSGLALGIDAAGHRGALRAEDGRTLAVLGSGLRSIFPRENMSLAEQVSLHGALLSELRPNTSASGPALMARDRIVSGLSRAVIVVEAGERSGTMDTARRARSQDRLLIAVPGSPGANLLLAGGAERLDPDTLDLDAFAQRIRESPVGGDTPQQLGLF
jgi:DNA processing protein